MATKIQQPGSNPFAAGAVVFDTSPIVQYELQKRAKQEALETALDESYRQAMKGMNTKGLRESERILVHELERRQRDYYIKNRDRLLKKDPQALTEFMQFNSDMAEIAGYGADLLRTTEDIGKAKLSPAAKYGFADIIVPKIEAFNQPAFILDANGRVQRNPSHKPFSNQDLQFNTKPYGIEEENQIVSSITKGLEPIKISETFVGKDPSGRGKFKEVKGYTNEQINTMFDRAKQAIKLVPSFAKHFNSLSKEEKNQLILDANKRFGKNILDGEDFEEAAQAAYFMAKIPSSVTSQSLKPLPALKSSGGSGGSGTTKSEGDNWLESVMSAVEQGRMFDPNSDTDVLGLLKRLHTGSNANYFLEDAGEGDPKMPKGKSVKWLQETGKPIFRFRIMEKDPDLKELRPSYLELDLSTQSGVYELARLYQRLTGKDAKFQRSVLTGVTPSAQPKKQEQPQKTITKDAFRKLSIAERQKLINEGVKVQ